MGVRFFHQLGVLVEEVSCPGLFQGEILPRRSMPALLDDITAIVDTGMLVVL